MDDAGAARLTGGLGANVPDVGDVSLIDKRLVLVFRSDVERLEGNRAEEIVGRYEKERRRGAGSGCFQYFGGKESAGELPKVLPERSAGRRVP
jgi:hypothetical protein